MKGTQMKLKRIIASLIAASVLGANALAFTPYIPEKAPEENTDTSSVESAEEEKKEQSVVKPYKPKNVQYELFEQILDLYVETHLYDFTKEEVISKFFEDFLTENPMYFSYFMNYLLGTMDPYSAYYPKTSSFLEAEKETSGFGFIIKDGENGVYIDQVVPHSNAEDAGFKAQDKFVSIAGINVEGHTFAVVSAILARPELYIENTQRQNEEESTAEGESKEENKSNRIEIIVDRNGEKIPLKVAKGPMLLSQISSMVVPNDGKPTAFIAISSFLGENTEKEFIELVTKYAQDGIKNLTVDLRNNGGGSLDYALSMAETFIEKDDLICYYNDKSLDEPSPVYSTTDKVSFDSITILINDKTASAAELFTSILKDKGLARVIGTKSFGKSLGQEVYSLVNGDHVTITSYQMLDSNLESYDGIGLYPDLIIEDVEMCYELPALGVFNHQNYIEIKENEYSDVTKALEDRLALMGILREEYVDGIFDSITKDALYVFQKDHGLDATGYVDYKTVSAITKLINSYKTHNYYDDTQYDVAMIVHHSFSQGKRLVAEREKLREKQSKKIAERDEALNAAYDKAQG